MWADLACQALRQGRVLELRYDGFHRCVEVHVVGVSRKGHCLMRVWQIEGGSSSQESAGWKLMRMDDVLGATISTEVSHAPRPGYNKVDPVLSTITCQV